MSPARSRAIAAAAAIAILTTAGGAAVTAVESVSDVSSALLVAEDLPPSLVSAAGITHEPAFDFDQASFEANGGIDAAAQTWQAPEVAPDDRAIVVFDFRFLFPDAEAAQAYLDAAEPVLSEVITGITFQPDTPAVGEVVRRYAGSLSQGDVSIDIQNVLFRLGPVVAKVYVAGFGTTLEDVLPIVSAAGARTETWLLAQMVATATTPPAPSASGISAMPAGAVLRQWAAAATASSEYGSDSWSATRATGEPDVHTYADDTDAWTPETSEGGDEWLELTYEHPVVPREVGIVESYGSGAVVRIEAYLAADDRWLELWSGPPREPSDEIVIFSPPLQPADGATDRIRITLDTAAVPSWNEIDAVELVGTLP